MFPLCLPFVTPGTEMSQGKETHTCTSTHTLGSADTHSRRNAEVTELLCQSKQRPKKRKRESQREKKINETQMHCKREKDAGDCANEEKCLKKSW